jgi:hypothetical protein
MLHIWSKVAVQILTKAGPGSTHVIPKGVPTDKIRQSPNVKDMGTST